MIRAALLDENDVYLGIETLRDASQLTPRHLPEITEADLPPGQYRWDRTLRAMLPLGLLARKPEITTASLEQVVYHLAQAVQRDGADLPSEVAEWMRWFGRRIEQPLTRKG